MNAALYDTGDTVWRHIDMICYHIAWHVSVITCNGYNTHCNLVYTVRAITCRLQPLPCHKMPHSCHKMPLWYTSGILWHECGILWHASGILWHECGSLWHGCDTMWRHVEVICYHMSWHVSVIKCSGYTTHCNLVYKVRVITCTLMSLSLIHIWRCRRYSLCRSRWSPYH